MLRAGLIDELQLTRALGEQQQWGKRLGYTLLKLGFVDEPDLVRVLARQLGVPALRLRGKSVDPEVLDLIPAELAQKYRCVPLFVKREGGFDVLYVGMEDPSNLAVVDELCFRIGRRVSPVLVGPYDLDDAIVRFYGATRSLELPPGRPFEEAPLEPGDTAPVLTGFAEDPFAPEPEEAPAAPAKTAAGAHPSRSGPAESERAEPASGRPHDVPTRTILRVVTELLIEKGVIERQELLERIRARHASSPGKVEDA